MARGVGDMAPNEKRAIAALVYDLRASGVTRNLLRIAAAARADGLAFEIWPLRAQGEFLERAKDVAPVRPVRPDPTQRQRDLDSVLSGRAIRAAIAARQPAILFSAGNQMHVHAARAVGAMRRAQRPRLVGRASNAVVSARLPALPFGTAIGAVERWQYRAMDHIVAVSEELGAQLVDTLGIAPDSVSIIPNGVAPSRTSRAAASPDDRPPVILGIGRALAAKRLRDADPRVRAVAAGAGCAPRHPRSRRSAAVAETGGAARHRRAGYAGGACQ